MSCLEGLRWRTDSGGLKHADNIPSCKFDNVCMDACVFLNYVIIISLPLLNLYKKIENKSLYQ